VRCTTCNDALFDITGKGINFAEKHNVVRARKEAHIVIRHLPDWIAIVDEATHQIILTTDFKGIFCLDPQAGSSEVKQIPRARLSTETSVVRCVAAIIVERNAVKIIW
jgi:hypothetical protein